MSDFLSFVVVEHIRFFHGAVQLRHEIDAVDCDRHWVFSAVETCWQPGC